MWAGCKNYALLVADPTGAVKEKTVVRGITIDASIKTKVNYEAIRAALIRPEATVIPLSRREVRIRALGSIETRTTRKTWRAVQKKNKKAESGDVYVPFGYRGAI